MKKVVHFEVHFVILYSKTELLSLLAVNFFSINGRFNGATKKAQFLIKIEKLGFLYLLIVQNSV